MLGAVAGGLLALYLVYPIAGGYDTPIGPDGPLYVWWTRFTEAHGLGAVPFRAGTPAATLVLGRILGTEPITTIALLGPALGVACGLAGAALLEALLGTDRLRTAAAAAFVGAWAGSLAGSYLANVALAGMFLVAAAALGVGRRSWRAVGGAAGLLLAAGLAHAAFIPILAAILAGVVALYVPEALAELRGGARLRDVFAVRVTVGATAGFLGAGAGSVALLDGAALRVDSSRDAFLRRAGLRGMLRDTFRLRTLSDLVRFGVPLASAGVLVRTGRTATGQEDGRYLRRLLGWWAVLSLMAFVIVGATGRGQANRLLAFGFFAPLAAAVALRGAVARRRAVAWIAAAVLVSGGMYGWYRQGSHMKVEERLGVEAAARSVAALPADTPLVFLVDTIDETAAAYHMTRYANVVRAGLPVDRIPHVRVALGRPRNFLQGRPTVWRELEHDVTSRRSLQDVRPVLDRAVVFVIEPFNVPWFEEAVGVGRTITEGVVAIGGRAGELAAVPAAFRPAPGPTGVPLLVVPLLLALLVLGGGWARWILPGTSPLAVLLAAPSVGLAATIVGGVAADMLGLALSSWAGVAVVAALGAAGYVLALRRR